MLKVAKKQELSLVPQTHTDLFVEHYDLLKRWALQVYRATTTNSLGAVTGTIGIEDRFFEIRES